MKRIEMAFARLWADVKTYWRYLAAFVVYDMTVQLLFHAFCPSVIVAGLPCPGCGMTRAVFYFATGRFAKGWAMNPLGLLWLALAVYFCVMRYWLGRRPKGVLQLGGVIAVAMAAFYFYRMYRFFPGEAPLVYTEGNLLERLVPGYRELALGLIGLLTGMGK